MLPFIDSKLLSNHIKNCTLTTNQYGFPSNDPTYIDGRTQNNGLGGVYVFEGTVAKENDVHSLAIIGLAP